MKHLERLCIAKAVRLNRSRRRRCLLVFLLVVCGPFAAGAEEAFDLAVIQDGTGCAWTGPADLDDPVFSAGCGATFTGTITLSRVPGANPSCPAVVSGPISGSVSGSTINFGLASTEFGNVTFTGTLATLGGGESASGTWADSAGTGTWFATDFMGIGGGTVLLTMTRPAGGCEWTGPMSGEGAVTIGGSVQLTRGTGAPPCPTTVSGPLSGKLFGSAICFEVTSTEFGDITYIGTVDRRRYSASGTWSGAPAGSGTWTARFPRMVRTPMLGSAALTLLLGVLMAAGMLLLRRRPD